MLIERRFNMPYIDADYLLVTEDDIIVNWQTLIMKSNMSREILIKTEQSTFPFEWANLENYRKTVAERREIYLTEDNPDMKELIFLFYSLFGNRKNNIVVYSGSWWDMTLETWNVETDTYNYEIETKSQETREYLKLLKDSEIENGYAGCCKCSNWDKLLPIILRLVINHIAPYSPFFCDIEGQYFFYFHHTFSIGIYYKTFNPIVDDIFKKAISEEYEIKP